MIKERFFQSNTQRVINYFESLPYTCQCWQFQYKPVQLDKSVIWPIDVLVAGMTNLYRLRDILSKCSWLTSQCPDCKKV